MALQLKHQTGAELANRIWLALRAASTAGTEAGKITAARICWRLYNRYQAGDFTVAELRNTYNSAFGTSLNATQFNNNVVPKLISARDRYQAILDEGDV